MSVLGELPGDLRIWVGVEPERAWCPRGLIIWKWIAHLTFQGDGRRIKDMY